MQPIDYLSGISAKRRARVGALLLTRESLFHLKLGWLFVGGMLLSMVGPLLVASFLYFQSLRAHAAFPRWDWLSYFNLCCGVMIPALLLVAHRGHENPFMDDLTEFDAKSSSYGEWSMRQDVATLAFWAGLFLIGPGMLLGGWDRLRARMKFGRPEPGRAAELVLHLYEADGGVDVAELLRPEESPEGLVSALRYLQLHDVVDFGEAGTRVWLCSPMKRRIAEALRAGRARAASDG